MNSENQEEEIFNMFQTNENLSYFGSENETEMVSEGSPNQLQFNSSSGNETQTRQRDEDLAKIEMAVLSFIFIVTLMGNFIVILGIYFRRQKMTRMYYFILHLSIADLITAFFNVGSQFIMELTFPRFLGGNFLCKFTKFTQILGPYSSSYVLVMTAIDRYQAICYPLSNCSWTARRSKLMLGTAWTISFLFCIPQIFIFSVQEVMGYPDCWASFPAGAQEAYVTWYAISFFIVPLMLLIFAYSCICRTIWMNFNMKTAAKNQEFEEADLTLRKPIQSRTLTGTQNDESVLFNKEELKQGTSKEIARGLSLNPRNSNKEMSKRLEVSWRIDNKGNVNTVAADSQSQHVTVAEKDSLYEVEDECLSEEHNDIRIVHTPQNGCLIEFHRNLKQDPHNSKTKAERRWSPKKNSEHQSQKTKFKENISDSGSKKRLLRANHLGTTPTVNSKISTTRQTVVSQPRTSSVKGISRAKIKTVKLTVTVICCYIFCSSPFITAQLWVTFDPNAYQSKFYTGATFTILTLLASLNSCVNPWIFLFFNPNLLQDFLRGLRCKRKRTRGKFHKQSGGSPDTQKTSPGNYRSNRSFNSTKEHRFANIQPNVNKPLPSSDTSSRNSDTLQ